MSTPHLIQSIIEIALTVFFIWGVWNEPKLAKAERKLFKKIKLFFGAERKSVLHKKCTHEK